MIKLLNSNRYELPGTNGRWIHLATLIDGLHEYICMYDLEEQKCYIEEILNGQLEFVHDEEVAQDLNKFLVEKNITNPKYGLPVAD